MLGKVTMNLAGAKFGRNYAVQRLVLSACLFSSFAKSFVAMPTARQIPRHRHPYMTQSVGGVGSLDEFAKKLVDKRTFDNKNIERHAICCRTKE